MDILSERIGMKKETAKIIENALKFKTLVPKHDDCDDDACGQHGVRGSGQ